MPVIEPIKGSSSVFGDKRARDRVKVHVESYSSTHSLETNEPGEYDLGKYNGERFWDSKQNWRPVYDSTLRQYDVRHTDGTLWTQADADKLCEEFPLQYPDGWKNASDIGKTIPRADISVYGDAYFSHPNWVQYSKEGRLEIPDSSYGKVLLSMAAGNGGVKVDDGKDFRSGDDRYYIKNPEMEAKRADILIDNAIDAYDLFKAIDDGDDLQKMSDILIMFGVDMPANTTKSKLRKTLHPYMLDAVNTEGGRTRQKLFIDYANMKDLRLAATVKLGVHRGHISSRAGSYMYKDTHIGSDFGSVVAFFQDIKNSQALDNLKEDLKNDSN